MTATTLAKVDRNSELALLFGRVFMMTLMLIGIYASGSLLKWAITKKLANADTLVSTNITAEMRERQLACLAKNIYHEAGYEPFEGKVAVAQVTINRTKSGQFPDDVCQTIYQKNVVYSKVICQFSWACDRDTGVRPINKGAYNESMEVAKKVLLEGFRLPSLAGALYYHADYINPGWNRQKIAHIGHHIFYR
jgi:spore germination cell wall hydrolase CwlJ-like protein